MASEQPPQAPDDAWKSSGVQVVPSDSLDANTAQTPGMDRKAAINFARNGAKKLWAGTVHIHPDAKTGAHHHGHLESVIYILKGRARMRWGMVLADIASLEYVLTLQSSGLKVRSLSSPQRLGRETSYTCRRTCRIRSVSN